MWQESVWKLVYILVFLGSLCLSLMFVPLVKRFAYVFNVLDHPSPRKVHTFPTPLTGGIAVYLSIVGTIIIGLSGKNLLPYFSAYSASISSVMPKLAGFLITSAVVVIVGFLDDIYHINPLTKILFQIICGLITFFAGIKISFFSSNLYVHIILTVLWIVVCMNSFNLLDHMNGLAAGVAFIAGSIFFFFSSGNGQLFISTLLACFLGSILGFLRYNFPCAEIFLGECGSSFIGYFLGCLAIMGTYYQYKPDQNFLPVLSPLLIFALPFFDTISVVYIRIKNKKPVFMADTNHLSHRLVRLGMSPMQAVIFCYLLTLACGIGALLLRNLTTSGGIIVFCQTLLILVCVALLESTGRKHA